MRRLVAEFLCSLFFAGVGFLTLAGVYNLIDALNLGMLGGDKGPVLSGILIGLPTGGIVGIVLMGRIIYGEQGWSLPGAVLALILCTIGNYFGLVGMDKLGSRVVVLLPMIAAATCVLGYSIGSSIRQ